MKRGVIKRTLFGLATLASVLFASLMIASEWSNAQYDFLLTSHSAFLDFNKQNARLTFCEDNLETGLLVNSYHAVPSPAPRPPSSHWHWKDLTRREWMPRWFHQKKFLTVLQLPYWLGLLACGLLALATRPRSTRAGECPGCRYNLAGIQADRCPECGKPLLHERHKPQATQPNTLTL